MFNNLLNPKVAWWLAESIPNCLEKKNPEDKIQVWGSDSIYFALETVHISGMVIPLSWLTLQVASQLCQFVSLYGELNWLKNKHFLKHKSPCNWISFSGFMAASRNKLFCDYHNLKYMTFRYA